MICLITGATAGIGKASAIKFANNGYDIIITGRRKALLNVLADEITKTKKQKVLTLNFDVQNKDEVQKAIASIPTEWQKIDVLVNNAGLASGFGPINEGKIDDWEQMINTNVKGLLYVSRAIMPLMIANKSGHIINIGSIAGKEVYANGNVYCATKHAVDALTKAMRIDLLPHNIKVTGIHPGMAETEFSIVRYKGDTEKASNVYKGIDALKGEDIAEAIYWAASQPAHVNIADIVLTPTAQANATNTIRK